MSSFDDFNTTVVGFAIGLSTLKECPHRCQHQTVLPVNLNRILKDRILAESKTISAREFDILKLTSRSACDMESWNGCWVGCSFLVLRSLVFALPESRVRSFKPKRKSFSAAAHLFEGNRFYSLNDYSSAIFEISFRVCTWAVWYTYLIIGFFHYWRK